MERQNRWAGNRRRRCKTCLSRLPSVRKEKQVNSLLVRLSKIKVSRKSKQFENKQGFSRKIFYRRYRTSFPNCQQEIIHLTLQTAPKFSSTFPVFSFFFLSFLLFYWFCSKYCLYFCNFTRNSSFHQCTRINNKLQKKEKKYFSNTLLNLRFFSLLFLRSKKKSLK